MQVRDWDECVPFIKLVTQKTWVEINPKVWTCRLHGTYFDIEQEPCWQCFEKKAKGLNRDGFPEGVKVYDFGVQEESYYDRFTVIIGKDVFGMSEKPNHPQGFNQYCGTAMEIDPTECGEKVRSWSDLPPGVQKAILERMTD
jgi:hypothetical protein